MHTIRDIRERLADLRSPATASRLIDVLSRRSRPGTNSLLYRLADVFSRTWDLGFTAFGGPPVHFQILHKRFVAGDGSRETWVDEQTFQELFALTQGLPGPASTKMLFCMTLIHAGFIPAVLAFLLWSLPGAIGMFSLALGVGQLNDTLPTPVYALLSGMNSSSVGIIALAGIQLSRNFVQDDLARNLVIAGACAGLCYNALWYFPFLMIVGGLTAMIWDGWLAKKMRRLSYERLRRRLRNQPSEEPARPQESISIEAGTDSTSTVWRRNQTYNTTDELPSSRNVQRNDNRSASTDDTRSLRFSTGIYVTAGFLASFILVMALRGLVRPLPIEFGLFANLYLAGTIIFGGGPVVIPLLRSYIVDYGWVTSRDFLLGLALIQAFPGPNFNLAVYLGALTLRSTTSPTVVGALLAFVAIFLPGLTLTVAVQSIWKVLRTRKWISDLLKGLNAVAIGLVFSAVYRLWGIGFLTPMESQGKSLGLDPWWLVVATISYSVSNWYGVPPALVIILGGILGLCWFGVVGEPS